MDRYQKMRADVVRVSQEVIGKPVFEANEICDNEGLACRTIRVDGIGCMITADCKMDRIGFIVVGGRVIETSNG